ncbi:10612_t:CDS:2 [Funneliformis caledonium]|uniref:10612_t:CDS:1 n=1 Tax=Funneliformis caledonium TaxID=1117310 RepID=A0A9N9CLI2_9GLOM|nr:10612_t:CDS:2 [Funneliformis caledonium]
MRQWDRENDYSITSVSGKISSHALVFCWSHIEPFDRKIDAYIKDLEIIDMIRGKRQQKARQLLDRYREASKNFPLQWWRDNRKPAQSFVIQGCSLSHKPVLEHKTDRDIVKFWEKECVRKQVHLHQRIGAVNGVNRTVNREKLKRTAIHLSEDH